jgi:hypothetical protein
MRGLARFAVFLAASLAACLAWDATVASWIVLALSGTIGEPVGFVLGFIAAPAMLCAGMGFAMSMFRPLGSVAALFAIATCIFLPWAACLSILALDCLLSTDCA